MIEGELVSNVQEHIRIGVLIPGRYLMPAYHGGCGDQAVNRGECHPCGSGLPVQFAGGSRHLHCNGFNITGLDKNLCVIPLLLPHACIELIH